MNKLSLNVLQTQLTDGKHRWEAVALLQHQPLDENSRNADKHCTYFPCSVMRWQLCGIGWWQAVCFCITQVCFSCVHPTRRWRFSSSAWVELSSNVYTMKVGCSSTRKFSLSLCYVTMFGKAPRSLTKPLDRLVHAQHTHTHARTGDGFNHRPTVAQRPPPPSKASTLYPPSYLPFILFQSVLALQPFISFLTSKSGPHHSFFVELLHHWHTI